MKTQVIKYSGVLCRLKDLIIEMLYRSRQVNINDEFILLKVQFIQPYGPTHEIFVLIAYALKPPLTPKRYRQAAGSSLTGVTVLCP